MLMRRVQGPNDVRTYDVNMEDWLAEGATILEVTPTFDPEIAIFGPRVINDGVAYEFEVSSDGTLGTFGAYLRAQTSDGQTREDYCQFVIRADAAGYVKP